MSLLKQGIFFTLPNLTGSSKNWLEPNPVQETITTDLWGYVPKYRGNSARADRYLGTRTDSALYLGNGSVFKT